MDNIKAETDLRQEAQRCSRCGACRSVCPVFAEVGQEAGVARGKVQLYRGLLAGDLEPTAALLRLAAKCTLCRACTASCPSGIPVDRIVAELRTKLVEAERMPALKKALLYFLTRTKLPPAVKALYNTAKACHVDSLGLPDWLPVRAFRTLPPLARVTFRQYVQAEADKGRARRQQAAVIFPTAKPRHRVAYFYGCANNFFYPQHGRDLLEVLAANQIEVVIPPQNCCGLPYQGSGNPQAARRLMTKNLEAFAQTHWDAVLSDCASCISTLRELGLGARIYEASSFLQQTGLIFPAKSSLPRRKITYHDPCHAARYLGIRQEPRKLLDDLPGVEFIEMAEPDRCCGGAGSFFLEQGPLSEQIGQKKLDAIRKTGADTVVTTCPGCLLQLSYLVKKEAVPVRAQHLISLLAGYYRQK